MTTANRKKDVLLNVLPFVLFIVLAFVANLFPGQKFDKTCWQEWAVQIYKHGLPNAYGAAWDNNYPPLFQYILYGYVQLQGSEEAVRENIANLRVFALFFDFLGIWYMYKWLDGKPRYLFILLLCMLNLGFSFNTIIWGQYDGVFSALSFIALYYAHRRHMVMSAVFMVLALNMKLQAIVFVPVWGLLWCFNLVEQKNWKTIVLPIGSMLAVQALLLVPFIQKPNGLQEVWHVLMGAVDYYPQVSLNAFNIWYLVAPADPMTIKDSAIFVWGMTYKQLGLLLFFFASFLVLLPMLLLLFRKMRNSTLWPEARLLWLVCALISLFFFFFNTQMHERYVHPAMIFLTAYTLCTKRWVAYVILSVAYVFSLERVMVGFEMDAWVMAVMYGCTIILLMVDFVKELTLKERKAVLV